jgi:hypothetical protein
VRRPRVDALIEHLRAVDPAFRATWRAYSPASRFWYFFTLRDIESRLVYIPGELPRLHAQSSRKMARYCETVCERDFPDPPDPKEWIEFSRDHERRTEALDRWRLRLNRFAAQFGASRPRIDCSLKPDQSVESKIRAYVAGTAPLDLWDNLRSRICAAGISEVRLIVSNLVRHFGSAVARIRNYILRHRTPPTNTSYRAIHLELRDRENTFIEVQVMTARRDAICLIDHSLVCKRAVSFPTHEDQIWLRQMSHMANILDSEQMEMEPPGVSFTYMPQGLTCRNAPPAIGKAHWLERDLIVGRAENWASRPRGIVDTVDRPET